MNTNPDKSPGFFMDWESKMIAVWFLKWQIEIYFSPRDWSFYYDVWGLLCLGPVVINWTGND